MRLSALLAAAITWLGLSFDVAAQSCAAPLVVQIPTIPPPVYNIDTCTLTNSLPQACDGTLPVPAPDVAFSFDLLIGNSPIFIVHPTGYDAVLFLLSATCNASALCAAAADSGSTGGTEVIPVAAYQEGQYFLVVDSLAASNNCGPTLIFIQGPLPVELQQFSID